MNQEQWERRECPQCAELVKRKAKICKECSYEFPDWKAQRKKIEEWEQRASVYGLDPWKTEAIIAAEKQTEWEQSTEGKAHQLAQEKKKQEEEKQRQERISQKRKERDKHLKGIKRAGFFVLVFMLILLGMMVYMAFSGRAVSYRTFGLGSIGMLISYVYFWKKNKDFDDV